MTKLSLLGVAAVAAYAALAVPAFAQHKTMSAVNAATEVDTCANHEPGNPYNKADDYLSWSAWRVRGGWDDHNDYNCGPSRINHSRF